MNWKKINRDAIVLLIQGKVKRFMKSKRFGEQYTVESLTNPNKTYYVDVKTKAGGTLLLCDCMNSICNKNGNICHHKLAVILYCQRFEVFND